MGAHRNYNVAELNRALENIEDNDAEAHKLYNNLGLAHVANGEFDRALKAHREEKRACKRLVDRNPDDVTLRLELAIAYRRCGDVMMKIERLQVANHTVISKKAEVLHTAHQQHKKGLEIARSALRIDSHSVPALVEQQAACAAMAQSSLAIALETRQRHDYELVSNYCIESAMLADKLPIGAGAVTKAAKETMMLGLSINLAIALSGLSEKEKAKTLFQAVALRAKTLNDDLNLTRAIANLAEEAGDEGDNDLCEIYVREWVRLAKKNHDQVDEGDALRKLGLVLKDKRKHAEACQVLQRALFLATTPHAKNEARLFLTAVEAELEDLQKMEEELETLEQAVVKFEKEGNFVEEAKSRITAGNIAFKLAKYDQVVKLLERYFILYDDYGCNNATTEVTVPQHNTSVANMGESMWILKRFADAVKWASREVHEYSGDTAGEAQAWCNLGIYLDDFGKKERAIEALENSVRLAKQAGDEQLCMRAQQNLDLVVSPEMDSEHDAPVQDSIPAASDHPATPARASHIPELHDVARERSSRLQEEVSANPVDEPSPMNGSSVSGERSIMVISSQPFQTSQRKHATVDNSQDVSIRRKPRCRNEMQSFVSGRENVSFMGSKGNSKSQPSRGGTTADCSSGGVKKLMDLAVVYKNVCQKRQHPTVSERPTISSALRSLSSTFLAKGTSEEELNDLSQLDLSGRFLKNDDLSALFETLSQLKEHEQIVLDISSNPTITAAAYESLNPRSFASISSLHGIKRLNLSNAGLSSRSLQILADALSDEGSLSNVSYLNASRNGLGRQSRSTAESVARLLFRANRVEVLDLSLNLLPNTFMQELLDAIDRIGQSSEQFRIGDSTVRSIDLHLNNRRCPTALLETNNPNEISAQFQKLFRSMPNLESVDIRACGGSDVTRKMLRELARSFNSFSRNIITVSPEVYEGE